MNITEAVGINDTSHFEQPQLDDIALIALPIGFILALCIIIANSVTIIAIIKVDLLWEKYAILVGSYSAADTLVGVANIITLVKDIVLQKQIESITCVWKRILLDNVNLYGPAVSHWHTVILTIDRYVAVQYPLTYNQKMTDNRVKVMILLAWLMTGAEASIESIWNGTNCILQSRIRPLIITVHLMVIMVINLILYMKIWTIAKRQQQKILDVNSIGTSSSSKKRGLYFDKATRMVFAVVVLFTVLWIPYVVFNVLLSAGRPNNISFQAIAGFIGNCNSLINNVVYFLLNKDFQYASKKVLHCRQGSN